ncbi:hypothetical protein D3C72_2492210 [compost metagenome]
MNPVMRIGRSRSIAPSFAASTSADSVMGPWAARRSWASCKKAIMTMPVSTATPARAM